MRKRKENGKKEMKRTGKRKREVVYDNEKGKEMEK